MKYVLNEQKQKLYEERQKIINIDAFPKDLTIISNNCIGGRLYHDYHKKFLTPTIDFYMEPKDFVKFCNNLDHYLKCKIIPLPEMKIDYLNNFLFCDIGGLIAGFSHTNDSYEKIMSKWEERKQRINTNNIVVICTDRNILKKPYTTSDPQIVEDFGKIPYKKVFFTNREYKYDYIAYLPSFKNEEACREATRPSLTKTGKYIIEEDGFDLDDFICNK